MGVGSRQAYRTHAEKDPGLGLTLCGSHLEILNNSGAKGLYVFTLHLAPQIMEPTLLPTDVVRKRGACNALANSYAEILTSNGMVLGGGAFGR